MAKKLLDFQASIDEVKQVNPLFSTCRVRVMYTGRNRNMSSISRDAVEKALPTLKNIPIVGEFNESVKDFKGHGGAIDLDSYRYIHTTKPYGVVPESATYEWEEVKSSDGVVREYLTIDGCYLWTGRYEEAFSVVERGKGQSMEIEVSDGRWSEEDEVYHIDNFTFSALCILGDDVEPAFESAGITAYSFNKDSFKKEFNLMLNELKTSLSNKREDNEMLKKLLKKYSTTMEDLTAKGLKFEEISEEDLEAKIAETLGVDVIDDGGKVEPTEPQEPVDPQPTEPKPEIIPVKEPEDPQPTPPTEPVVPQPNEPVAPTEPVVPQEPVIDDEDKIKEFEVQIANLKIELADANEKLKELEVLKQFKLDTEKEKHEAEVQKVFSNFQLNDKDVENIDVHKYSLEEIEDKCYAILGRKMAKKNFSNGDIHLPINPTPQPSNQESRYGDLLD